MTDEIDKALRGLATMPVHPRLAARDADVLSRVFVKRGGENTWSLLKLGALAVLGALALGMVGAGVPEATMNSDSSLFPLGPMALAPSTLLAGK